MIYKKFKIANQTIRTKLVSSLEGGEYGKFNDAKNEILLATNVEVDGETIELTVEQIENTYWHEVIHAFQFYFNNSYDEAQAQCFSNFICEMRATGDYHEIDP